MPVNVFAFFASHDATIKSITYTWIHNIARMGAPNKQIPAIIFGLVLSVGVTNNSFLSHRRSLPHGRFSLGPEAY